MMTSGSYFSHDDLESFAVLADFEIKIFLQNRNGTLIPKMGALVDFQNGPKPIFSTTHLSEATMGSSLRAAAARLASMGSPLGAATARLASATSRSRQRIDPFIFFYRIRKIDWQRCLLVA